MIGASQFLTFEYPLLFWMESRGFDVSYMSCTDFHDDLIGARLVDPAVGVGDWRCANTGGPLASRIYNGTGLGDNDRIRGLIGHEFTGNPVGRPGLEVLAEENPVGGDARVIANTSTATIYPGPKGNLVFNASTLWWPQWLNFATPLPFPAGRAPQFTWSDGAIEPEPTGQQAVERMTLNLFDMFRA